MSFSRRAKFRGSQISFFMEKFTFLKAKLFQTLKSSNKLAVQQVQRSQRLDKVTRLQPWIFKSKIFQVSFITMAGIHIC